MNSYPKITIVSTSKNLLIQLRNSLGNRFTLLEKTTEHFFDDHENWNEDDFVIVFADCDNPDFSFQFIARLKACHSNISIVAVSNEMPTQKATELIQAGVTDCIETKQLSQPLLEYLVKFGSVKSAAAKQLQHTQTNVRKKMHEQIMDASFDGIICVNRNEEIVSWNKTAAVIFGWKEEEVIGKKLSSLVIPKRFLEKHRIGFAQYEQTGKSHVIGSVMNLPAIRVTGEEFMSEISINEIKVDDEFLLAVFVKDISDKIALQNKLKQSVERFELLAKVTDEAIYETDLLTGQSWANEAHQKLYGLTSADSVPAVHEWYSRIHPLDVTAVTQGMENAKSNGALKWSSAYRFLASDGSWKHISDRTYIQRDKNGVPVRIIGSMVDITDTVAAETELNKIQKQFKTITEQAEDAIVLFNPFGEIVYANKAIANLLGYSLDEFYGCSIFKFIDKDELAENPVQFELLFDHVSVLKQRRLCHKSGKIIHTEIRTQLLEDGSYLSLIRDLTDRIQFQEKLQAEKELSESIIKSLPGVFYCFDHTGKFIRWNDSFETVTGYSAEEIANMHPLDFFNDNFKQYIADRIGEVFVKGISNAEAEFTSKTGEQIPFYYTGVMTNINKVPSLLGVGIDISDRKEAEQQLERSIAQVRALTAHLQNIREQERAKVAFEIHEQLGQLIAVSKINIQWLADAPAIAEHHELKSKLLEVKMHLDTLIVSVRSIASTLRPGVLDDLGLVAAIECQLADFSRTVKIKTRFTSEEFEEQEIKKDKQLYLFRLIEDSLDTLFKETKGHLLDVMIKNDDQTICITLTDDSKAAVDSTCNVTDSIGIISLKERIRMLGGMYNINSLEGGGRMIEIKIPK